MSRAAQPAHLHQCVCVIATDSHRRPLRTNGQGCVPRVYPYLCRAVRNFARDHGNVPQNKEFYVALEDLPTRHK